MNRGEGESFKDYATLAMESGNLEYIKKYDLVISVAGHRVEKTRFEYGEVF